jgi:hypothetical protein
MKLSRKFVRDLVIEIIVLAIAVPLIVAWLQWPYSFLQSPPFCFPADGWTDVACPAK